MKYVFVAACALACTGGAVPASALQFVTSFTRTGGPATTASLTFTTSSMLNTRGGYDITGVSGDVNGVAITGTVANPNQPHTYLSNNVFNISNVAYDNGPLLDSDGVAFATADGKIWNMWVKADLTVGLSHADPNGSGGYTYMSGPTGTLTPYSITPASQPAGPSRGVTTLTFEDARPYLFNTLASQGFYYSTPAHGYVLAQGFTTSGANNGTERIMYNTKPVTMTAVDHSNFSLTSLDAGAGYFSNPAVQSLDLTIIGQLSGGRTVTQTLTVGPSFATYALNGFTDLRSLTFQNSASGYVSFDNIKLASTSVPEPVTWAMFIGGFGMIGAATRRRQKVSVTSA